MKKSLINFKIKRFMLVSLVFLFLLLMFTSIQVDKISKVEAAEGPDENGLYYSVYSNRASFEYASPTVTSITIPETYKGKPVTSIYMHALKDAKNLKHITIPGSAINTPYFEMFFQYSSSLESINITGNHAKYYTDSAGIMYVNTETGISLGCYPAKKYGKTFDFPGNVIGISSYAFQNNYYLEEINLSAGFTEFDERPFGNCQSLKAVNIPEENEHFLSDDGVLYNKSMSAILYYPANKPLKSQIITANQNELGAYAFDGQNYLTSINIPSHINTIGRGAFASCEKLEYVQLPNSYTTLPAFLFQGCISLKEITLPSSLQILESAVFRGTSLTYIEIPAGVTELQGMYGGVFHDCVDLTMVVFKRPTPPNLNPFVFRDSGIERDPFNARIFVPASAVSAYKGDDKWSNYVDQIFYNPNTYVEYELNGGKFNGYLSIDSNTVAPMEPTKGGYDFVGWNNGSHVIKHPSIALNNTSAQTLTASWSLNTYNIEYNMDGGINPPENLETYTAETFSFNLTNPTKAGYIFLGWSGTDLIGANNTTVSITQGSFGHRKYTAHWTPSSNTVYKIEFYQQNIEGNEYILFSTDSDLTGTTGEMAYILNYENKYTGFTYTSNNSITSGTITGDGSLTLKAYYNRNIYTATFVNDNDPTYNVQNLRYGANIVQPADPTKQATAEFTYTFSKWDKDIPDTISDNITFNAIYIETRNTFTVTFNYGKNSTITQNVGYGLDAVAPTNIEKEGYTFSKWDKTFTHVTTALTVTAQYQINSYTITFNSNGGSGVEAKTQDY